LAVPPADTPNPLDAVVAGVTERSLDEFANEGDTEPNDGAAEPSVATMRWAGGGQVCGDCGETVGRLWRDGGAFVCTDCKAW
jgi:hypothetical protein